MRQVQTFAVRATDKGSPSLSCAPDTTGCAASDPQPVGYTGEACALISALQASAEDGDAAWEPIHPHRRARGLGLQRHREIYCSQSWATGSTRDTNACGRGAVNYLPRLSVPWPSVSLALTVAINSTRSLIPGQDVSKA